MNKSIKSIIRIFIIISALIVLSGCSKASRSQDEILLDLENAGFKVKVSQIFDTLSEMTKNNEFDMSCTIISNELLEMTNTYECNVLCANSDFEMSFNVTVVYTKDSNWDFSKYEISNTKTKMYTQIPEERILSDIQQYFVKFNENVDVDKTTISQKIDDMGIGCKVSAIGTVSQGILSKQCNIQVSYIFADIANEWHVYVESNINSFNWDVQALAGKKWVDTYKWSKGDFIYIESVDETNSTMNIGYRKGLYSSTIDGPYEEHGKPIKCTYTFDKECIKVLDESVTLKFYPDMHTIMSGYAIYPDTEVEESNNKNTTTSDLRKELRIGWSEFKPLSYYNSQKELVGFDTELAQYVCEYCGWKPIFIETPFDDSFKSIQNGTIDCYWSGMAKTEERMEISDFTAVYLSTYIDDEYENFSVPCTKGDSELVNKINKALQAARENGTIQNLKTKYGLK